MCKRNSLHFPPPFPSCLIIFCLIRFHRMKLMREWSVLSPDPDRGVCVTLRLLMENEQRKAARGGGADLRFKSGQGLTLFISFTLLF